MNTSRPTIPPNATPTGDRPTNPRYTPPSHFKASNPMAAANAARTAPRLSTGSLGSLANIQRNTSQFATTASSTEPIASSKFAHPAPDNPASRNRNDPSAPPAAVSVNDTSNAAASPSSATRSLAIIGSSRWGERSWHHIAVIASRKAFIQFQPEYSPTASPNTPIFTRWSMTLLNSPFVMLD